MGTQESHIRELLVWIEDNLTNPLSLDIVSAKSGYTKWYLQRMFKKQTGLSLASYIRARRLYLAAFALRFTQKSILDISVEYQFDNQQTFSRCFKKHFAESPSVYRHARKQDFSNLVRSLAASQPGDIQVERVSIARGQYAFHGKHYAYHLDIEKLDKSHLPQRSALRGQFYTLLGERPTQTYSFTQLVPDGERVRVDYTLGVTTEYPLREGVVLETLPEIHGEFCRFRYSGKPVALNDHIIKIYTQVLPEMGLARGDGPDITVFSYSLSGKRSCIWSCSIWCRWCRCTDPVGGRQPVFLLHDCRHHRQGDLRRGFAAQRQADRRMDALQLQRREFGNLLQTLAPPRAVSERSHGPDVKRRGVDRFHQRQIVHTRIVSQRHDGGIGVTAAVLDELGRKLTQQRHARFQLGGEVIQRLRAVLAHQHLKPQRHGEISTVQRHAGQPGDQQARRGRDVQGDLLEPAFDLRGAGEVALLEAVAGVGQRQAFDQRVMPFQRAGDASQVSDAVFTRRQVFDQHVQHAAAGQRHVGRHAAFAVTDHLAGRLILPGGHAPQKVLLHAPARQ